MDSVNHTAVSWWYLGEEDGHYYVVEKWPLKWSGYRVSKMDMDINIELDVPKELSLNKSDWLNLKAGQLQFY